MIFQTIYDMLTGFKTRLNMKSEISKIKIQKEGQDERLDGLSEEYKNAVE